MHLILSRFITMTLEIQGKQRRQNLSALQRSSTAGKASEKEYCNIWRENLHYVTAILNIFQSIFSLLFSGKFFLNIRFSIKILAGWPHILLFIAAGHQNHCPDIFETSGKLSAPRSFFSRSVLFQLYSMKQAGGFVPFSLFVSVLYILDYAKK